MSKLKKKKSKKRAKSVLQKGDLARMTVSELADDSIFDGFCRGIDQNSKHWITAESYVWAVPGDAWKASPLLSNFSVARKSCPAIYKKLDDTLPESVPTHLTEVLEMLTSVLVLARYASDFSPSSVSRFLNSLETVLADESMELLESNPAIYQLLYGEIPLTLGLRFPMLKESESWIERGQQACIVGLEECLDGDGVPGAPVLPEAGLLLASWTRCMMICDLGTQECLDVDAQTQFEFFVRQMIRLTRKDGSLVFSDSSVDLSKIIQAALRCYHDEEDANLAAYVYPKSAKGKKTSVNALPECSACSEWGELAILQSEWTPKAPKLIVDFHGRKLQAELSVGGVLLSGAMQHEILLDNQLVTPSSDWEVVCWHSDEDGDFLELECDLENGAKWQKQFLLARNEMFLLTGDVVLNAEADEIRVSGNWDLGPDSGFGLARETRELFLTRKAKTAAAILPISLPEWRVEKRDADLIVADSQLQFQTVGSGSNLYFPLFFDLDPKRCRQPMTWRQATVAEQLEILPPSEATGFRVHVGSQQWLIYRSLISPGNRTFMGQNLAVEFFVGTFEPDGTSSEIISVN